MKFKLIGNGNFIIKEDYSWLKAGDRFIIDTGKGLRHGMIVTTHHKDLQKDFERLERYVQLAIEDENGKFIDYGDVTYAQLAELKNSGKLMFEFLNKPTVLEQNRLEFPNKRKATNKSTINEDMSEEDYDEFFSIVDAIKPAINAARGDMDDINGNLSHPYNDEDRIKIVFVSTVDRKDARRFKKTVESEIEKALSTTRFNRVRDIYVYQLEGEYLRMYVPDSLRNEFSQKFCMFEIDIRASSDF